MPETKPTLNRNDLPRELFINSLMYFHELLGSREFWNSTLEQRKKNIDALAQDFIRTNHPDLENDTTLLESALEEYAKRENWLIFKPAIWRAK